MTTDQNGSATDTGATEQAPANSNPEPKQPTGQQQHMIPKGRFDEVVGQKKAAEAALEEIATSIVEEVPEDMRDLIPADLPPAARIKWVRAAMAKGIFGGPAGVTNPDAKRPGAKAPADMSGMNPRQMMAMGYTTSK